MGLYSLRYSNYDSIDCYTIYHSLVREGEKQFYLNMVNVSNVINKFNIKNISLSEFENKIYSIKIIIICYHNNKMSKFELPLYARYIFHNHSNMFQI